MTDQLPDSREPGYFHHAMRDLTAATEGYSSVQLDLIAVQAALSDKRRVLQSIEDDVLADGGVGEHVIDGKNSEARAAQLRRALEYHRPWVECKADVDRREREKSILQARLDNHANELSAARRRCDYAIAEVHREAAVKAALGTERSPLHGGR